MRAVDAARYIHRDDRQAGGIDALDQLSQFPLDRTGETRTEQRIHHDIGAGKKAGTKPHARSGEALGHGGRVVGKARLVAVEAEPDLVAPFREETRGNEAVPAIVAGTAQDRDRLQVGEAARHLLGDGAARIFHEGRARHAARDGEAVGASHLLCGQKLKHRFSVR